MDADIDFFVEQRFPKFLKSVGLAGDDGGGGGAAAAPAAAAAAADSDLRCC